MRRRAFLSGVLGCGISAAPVERPNVLLVMSDQESALLPGPANLPNRRKLEREATVFTQAFCNTPQCSPARSSLLTGLAPHQTGVLTNVDAGSIGKGLSPKLPNAGNVFRDAGYTTGYFGKWHLGGSNLRAFGFSTSFTNGTGDSQKDPDVAAAASDWIRHQKRPWLAWVSLLNPHHIYDIPRVINSVRVRSGVHPPYSTLSDLRGKPAEQQQYVDEDQGQQMRDFTPEQWLRYRSYYLELVETVDAQLGTILAGVPELDSTIVVYTSDHGDALGEHGLPYKGPFMYEEEIRVPLVIRAPQAFRKRRTSEQFVTSADVAPTLASLAGIHWPDKVSGQDLSKPSARDAVFLEYYAKQKWTNPLRTIRTRNWKLNWYDRGNQELYDLERDSHEVTNLATDLAHARQKKVLEDRLNAWRKPLL